MPLPPSAYGFINIEPKSREYRRSLKDKVALERRLLSERNGPHARMHQQNAPATSAGLTSCAEDGAGYLATSERFHTDTCGEERATRVHAVERRKQVDEFRRQQGLQREESRWDRMEAEKKAENEHWDMVRASGVAAQKNKSKSAYNILSLDYVDGPKGREQKHYDDMVKYRAHLRSQNLTNRSSAGGSYNIISGEPIEIENRQRPERK